MSGKFSFDSKCGELAEHFLNDYFPLGKAPDDLRNEFAQYIQAAVEEWLNYEESRSLPSKKEE